MSSDAPGIRGTRANSPDLDWSQVRETVLMLELAAGQVEAAMRDSNTSVDVLTDTFTSMAGLMRMVEESVAELPNTDEVATAKAQLMSGIGLASDKVHHAIIAFQFYDKLVQRLAHVCHSLGSLSNLVGDKSKLYNPHEWVGLQEKIRSKFTMVEERAMFEEVLNGASVEDALNNYKTNRMQEIKESGGDVEFF
jgi:hypothetical protein